MMTSSNVTSRENGGVVIGKGNLDGKGVYAGRDFQKGEVVVEYHLKPITPEEYDSLPESEKQFAHSQDGIIHLYSAPERYVNYSDDPNTYQDFERQADIALRHIKKGEVVTTNVSKDDI